MDGRALHALQELLDPADPEQGAEDCEVRRECVDNAVKIDVLLWTVVGPGHSLHSLCHPGSYRPAYYRQDTRREKRGK